MSPGLSKKGFLDPEDEPMEEIIDEQELFKLKEMKELKRQYRDAFLQLKELKNQAVFNQKAIDNAKTQLVNDFEIWYSETFTQNITADSALGMQSIDGTSVKSSAAPKKRSGSPPKIIRDTTMDDDLEPDAKEREGVDVDNDALAYIRARKNVMTLAAAKKLERA